MQSPTAISTAARAAAASRRPLVRLQHVSKVYSNGTIALRDMSLAVEHGDFVTLLGPSGCGKSTALRIIAGLGDATEGTIDWPVSPPDQAGDPERQVGFVFQDPTLMPWATVYDNVRLPLRLRGNGGATVRDEIMAALEMVGLAGFARSYPRELSGGMKMRVSIARALVTRPMLLLMDEPFAALDEITRFKLNDDLLALREKLGWTVIFVTHSVFESVYLSNRVVVMAARPGRVFAEVEIDAGYPRDETFRTSAIYAELCRRTSERLQAAIASVKQ